jgi:large repetitive protein
MPMISKPSRLRSFLLKNLPSLMLPILLVAAHQTRAQNFVFAGVQTTLPTSGLSKPEGLAFDSTGNLYIADTGNNRVVEITSAGVQKTVLSGTVSGAALKAPKAVAVDASFDLFVADSGNNRVLEISPQGAASTVGTGLSDPSGIALTGTYGTVMIADTGNNRLIAVIQGVQRTLISTGQLVDGQALSSPQGLSVAPTTTQNEFDVLIADTGNNRVVSGELIGTGYSSAGIIASGLSGPQAVTFATPTFQPNGLEAGGGYGYAYIADTGNGQVFSESESDGIPQALVSNGMESPSGMAADGSGNVYIADSKKNCIWKIATGPAADFGNVNVGTKVTLALTFSFVFGEAWPPPVIVTQGASNLDFSNANSGTCTPGTAFADLTNCILNVTFQPTAAGMRPGELTFTGPTETVYLHGIGVGPQIEYDPGTQTTLATGFNDPRGVAVDGNSNVYVADFGDGQIVKVTPTGAKSNFLPLNSVSSLSIDGGGNLYAVGDGSGEGNLGIFQISPTGAVISPELFYNYASDVVLDGSGDVFVADIMEDDILETDFRQDSALYYGGGFTPKAVAVDGSGNLFIVDSTDWLVWKCTPSREWSLVGSGYNRPAGIAVDGFGNVFVADFGNNRVVKVTPAGVQSTVGSDLIEPSAIALDSYGNIFITELGNGQLVKINRHSSPGLSFASTEVGKTSSDSPRTITIENAGNAPLTFPIPAKGENAGISANFTVGGASTCPVLSSASSAATLAAGSSCTYNVRFVPTVAGIITGSLVTTDNNLNVANSEQTDNLKGTATAASVTVKWEPPAAILAGTALSAIQLNADASVPGKFVYNPTAGAKLTRGAHTLTAAFTPEDTSRFKKTTATVVLVVK